MSYDHASGALAAIAGGQGLFSMNIRALTTFLLNLCYARALLIAESAARHRAYFWNL